MSRLANVSDAEVAAWFDPKKNHSRVMPRTRLFGENLRSIVGIPMPLRERFRCARVLFADWVPRYWRVVGGEFKRELLAMFRSKPAQAE